MLNLNNQVAVVTGGARGIGREIALTLAKEGAAVAIIDIDQAEGPVTEADLNKLSKGLYIAKDITEVPNIKQAVAAIYEKFQRLDILVNNAGISIRCTTDEITEEQWDSINGINLKGAFFLSQESARIMMSQGRGKIVNIASIRGYLADLTHSAYSITKAGLHAMTRSFALSLAPYNINVNSVSPGYVLTPMTEHNLKRHGWLEQLRTRVPLGRPIEMKEIAETVSFLVSDKAKAITGQDIIVDGGWTINAGL